MGCKLICNTLPLHCICNLQEASDVCTNNQVAFHAIFLGSVICIVEDVDHDALQLCINFFECPRQTTGVTRGRKLCIVVGRRDVVNRMMSNIRQNLRYSGLAALLAQALPPEQENL